MDILARLLRFKLTIWLLLLAPFPWAVWPIFFPTPTNADPLKSTLLHLGLTASILLAITLTLSPLRVLFPQNPVALALNRHRRLIGVSVFAYALLHFAAHMRHVYDGAFDTFFKELQKPFQLTGLVALTILLVLTITSLHALVRLLGGKAWKNLHRLVYLCTALVIYHQAAARKIFPMQVVYIFAPVLLLEVARIAKKRRQPRITRNAPAPSA